MKTQYLLLAMLSLTALSFQSCLKDKCSDTITYTRWDAVYKTVEEVHNTTVNREAPRALKAPGQINYYENRMYVVEKEEGIHIINNSDPSNPVATDFIAIEGVTDLSIKDGFLFVNSYTDLLVIDINSYTVVGRTENVLQPLYYDVSNGQVLVGYKETEVTEKVSCEDRNNFVYQNNNWVKRGGGFAFDDAAFEAATNSANSSGNVGIGGSLSHFTIIGDYLYTIQHDGYNLEIYDISSPTNPNHAVTVNVGVHLETLFPYGDKLFVGSNVGMYIYDNSDPLNPKQLSVFEHARACDPVYVHGHYAYVTLWDGSSCGSGPNQLDVIDISDLQNPVLLRSFPMKNPHGLSVKNNTLLLCEGDFGLETYDNTVPETVGDHLLGSASSLHALDVIALPGGNDVAMVIGDDGFYQYDFSDPTNLKLLSFIPVEK